ncbi:HAD family hydrolase [Natronocalculus amylovorans]|uniref:HAD family hydrolase n=1 Tax=Natronocalculus amylovorans TaxID=2917812 RepID=A0AAE3FVK8_9EURY|nr:HAD family hydrolase [Natronocalculus amylovorans]MCL9816362.1 HAD family hydrolase [Natronocalculus amylovorans]
MYDAVLFDNDGVLVSRTAYEALQEAAWTTFMTLGIENPDPDDVESIVIGVSPETVQTLSDRYDVDPDTLWETRDEITAQRQYDEIDAGRKTPYNDVNALSRLGMPLGIISSNQQATVDYLVDRFSFYQSFSLAYGREPEIVSLERKKPAPFYLERAVNELEADTALFVGDNDSDMRAAANAGIDSAFIRRPHRHHHNPTPEPTYIVNDLHDVVDICRRGVSMA